MKLVCRTPRARLRVLALASFISLAAAGCTTSGNSFNTTAAHQLVVGQTTMADAVRILGADPVNSYRQTDGSVTSIWSHKSSVLTDAIYLNQELWLAFGPDGRFNRVVKKHNLPITASTQPAPQPSALRETQPVILSASPNPTPTGVHASVGLPQKATDLNQPAVSYPVNPAR